MARRLQALVVDLLLEAEAFLLREGDLEVPDGFAAAGARWELGGPWENRPDNDNAESFVARATLIPSSGGYPVHDGEEPVERVAQTPRLRADGARAWFAIELYTHEPDDTDVLFRLVDGDGVAYWFDGDAWTAATDPAEWNTGPGIVDNLATWPHTALGVAAWLRTLDGDVTPEFYGCRVAYGVRDRDGDEGDALRVLVKSLRDELRVTSALELTTTGTTASIEVVREHRYDVIDVDAVYVDGDGIDATAVPGSFTAGSVDADPPRLAVWRPDAPIGKGRSVRLEYSYRPHISAHLHVDSVTLDRLPAVYIGPAGLVPRMDRGQGPHVIRNVDDDDGPSAMTLAAPTLVELDLDVRAIAELPADARRISRELRGWLGAGGYRLILSAETGRLITVREVDGPRSTSESLAAGVPEARTSWRLTFHVAAADDLEAVTLIRDGGVDIDLDD